MRDATSGPADALRDAVGAIWCDSLAVTEVHDEDDFFLEGGESVLAVEVAMRLRELTAVEVDLDILYQYPQFGRLVSALAERRPTEGRAEARALTPTEERLWVVEQLHPGAPTYHISALYRFDGTLDVARLRAALDGLTDRHAALRRAFESPGRALTAERVTVPCRWLDARDVPEAAVRQALEDEARTPLDLASPPLLRALVVSQGTAGDLLLLTVHHLVCDGDSLSVLEAHLGRLYAGTSVAPGGAPARVPVAQTVSRRLQDPRSALAYWEETLVDCPPGIALPHDLPRPGTLGTAGAVHAIPLAQERLAALFDVARQERLSPYMTWIAAYLTGLVAVTGDRDVVITVPVSARGAEQRDEVGMFVDTLPLRFTLSPGATTRELARTVRGTVTQALAHAGVPEQTLLDRLRLPGDRRRAPLAQVALTYLDTAERPLSLGGLQAERVLVPTGTAKYELLWEVTRRADGTVAELEYHAELFSDEAAAALHQRLIAAVEAAFARPDAALLAGAEPGDRAPYQPVHERFRQQALARPDTIAIEHGDQQLTYRELADRADRVAAGLHAAGLGRGDVIAVPMERGVDMVTACLGVLYAGGAYCPVDVRQPAARVWATVRAIAQAALVAGDGQDTVSDRAAAASRTDPVPVPVLALGQLLALPTSGPLPPRSLTGEDTAYVMSTSGSSGAPKAVVIPHRAVSRLVPDADYLTLSPDDRVAHLSNPGFDAATFEIWGALASGATLVVGDRSVALSPARLKGFLEEQRITVMWLTASLLNQVVDFAPDALRHLRVLLSGGEKHDERRLQKLLGGCPPARVVNGYGPTENTTFSTTHDISAADLAAGIVPIGRAISGTTAHVLDATGQPVPVGEAGELFVGGEGVAQGYLNAPAMTAAAFVPDPFDPRGGRRMYRTGDRVRLGPRGVLEFLGRTDDQVKVRGFRVELGEVELAVRRQDEVADVVVLGRPTEYGTEIVACVTPATGDTPAVLDVTELNGRLRRELPEYMVPTFVVLDQMPVNANGKADRAAVRSAVEAAGGAPTGSAPAAAESHDPLAAAVAAAWCEVLAVERADPADNFLALGGHSIKALRLLTRLDEVFAAQLDLAAFFEDPTLGGVTALIRKTTGETGWRHHV